MLFFQSWPFRRHRKLGVGERKGGYDLPLSQSAGSHFLILLVGLMTFLALMAITTTLVLGGITKHWSSGLENKVTIEIPAQTPEGALRESTEIRALAKKAAQRLKENPNIKELLILQDKDIHALVSPWLGDDVVLDELPLPGLISVDLHVRDDAMIKSLQSTLKTLASDIRLDTHEEWLADILRLAGTLKFSALIVTLIIALTTVVAIAGAIRSRMAEHKADIELLHLMGASDLYITRQLQRHAVLLTFKGALAGAAFGLFILLLMVFSAGQGDNSLIPGLFLSPGQILLLFLLPVFISLIASQTARFTVLRVLGQMP